MSLLFLYLFLSAVTVGISLGYLISSDTNSDTHASMGSGSLAASASSFCSLACRRLKHTHTHTDEDDLKWQQQTSSRLQPPCLPAVLLVLGVEPVGLLSLLGHPARHQLLVVLGGLSQLLLQGGEGDLQGVVLILQRLVRPLQVL